MADTTYKVIIDMESRGSLESKLPTQGKLDMLDKRIDGIGHSVLDVGGRMSDVFTGVVDKAVKVGTAIAGIGAAFGAHQIVSGVVNLNAELEKTQMGLATIFSANGVSRDMTSGMALASELMSDMRKDAAALTGESSDLVEIFRSIALPGVHAGGNVKGLEKLSANIMNAGAASGLDMHMVAREAGQLVAGRAGAHNILGSTLFGLTGDAAEKFNAMDPGKRLEYLTKALAPYEKATATLATGFDALSSTARDNFKNLKMLSTRGLFTAVKDSLSHANQYYATHQKALEDAALTFGSKLEDAWRRGEAAVVRWYPLVDNFAEHLGHRLGEAWDKVKPLVGALAQRGGGLLADPDGTIDKMERLGATWAALKMARPLASAAEGLGVGGGAAGAGVIAGAAVDAYAITEALQHVQLARSEWADMMERTTSGLVTLERAFDRLGGASSKLVDVFGTFLTGELDATARWFKLVSGEVDLATRALGPFADKIGEMVESLFGKRGPQLTDNEAEIRRELQRDIDARRRNDVMASVGRSVAANSLDPTKNKHINGGGGTNIQKVEIVVHQNSDPSRVARAVVDKLADMQRYRTASRDVPNYSR